MPTRLQATLGARGVSASTGSVHITWISLSGFSIILDRQYFFQALKAMQLSFIAHSTGRRPALARRPPQGP